MAVTQGAFGILRALGWFEIGSDLMGRGVVLLPIFGDLMFVRGALVAGIALLYVCFAWGLLKGRSWARTAGLSAAVPNLLLTASALVEEQFTPRALLWCVVPVVVVWYLLTQPRPSSVQAQDRTHRAL